MDNNFSENWFLLLKLISDEAISFTRDQHSTLQEHQQAQALAIFLAHANLATPELNRTTVAAILKNEITWPRLEGERSFTGTHLPLAFFEEEGFISFLGDWIVVHCRQPEHKEDLDQSIKDLLHVTEHFHEIRFGYNGYTQPNFIMEEGKLYSLLSNEFGNIPLKQLLPGFEQLNDNIRVMPESQNFGVLESSYLWRHLLQLFSPELAFKRWMLCVRVQTLSIVPIQFTLLDETQKTYFLEQFEAFVKTAPEFNYSLNTLCKQTVNAHDFNHLVTPKTMHVNVSINDGNSVNIPQTPEKHQQHSALTINELKDAYRLPKGDDLEDINVLNELQQHRYWLDPMASLAWLVQECLIHAIHVNKQNLSVKAFATRLLGLTELRMALKYILFAILPQRYNWKYLLFLLSKSETCDIALYHLTSHEYSFTLNSISPPIRDLDKIYLELLIAEYLNSARVRPNNGSSLLKIVLYLADHSNLYSDKNTENFQYKALNCLQRNLDDISIVEITKEFILQPLDVMEQRVSRIRERSIYHTGLWLTERLESVRLVDPKQHYELCDYIFDYYSRAFNECFLARKRDLDSDMFFASLSWECLVKIKGIRNVLALSARYEDWYQVFTYENEYGFFAVSAARQYLQLLMSIVKYPLENIERERVWSRITNIVCSHGFGTKEGRLYLFQNALNDDAVNLWKSFSSFLNTISESFYEEFFERCIELIPLDSLYILLERCNIHSRGQDLQQLILKRQDLKSEGLSLVSLETAFTHACHNAHMELANGILLAAIPILDRLKTYKNNQVEEIICRWENYRYKYTLLSLYLDYKNNPDEFEIKVKTIASPNEGDSKARHSLAKLQYRECEEFKQYIVATAFCVTEPEKSVCYMERLCSESKNPNYAYTLFKGRVAIGVKDNDKTLLLHGLNEFLEQLTGIKPQEMDDQWVYLTLETMRKLNAYQQADDFWRQLDAEQHRTREILLPYCTALIERGEPLVAQQILNDFQRVNSLISDQDSGLVALLEQLSHALPEESSIISIYRVMAESHQRSMQQLRHHYDEIISCSFEDYVQIVGDGGSKEEFLKDIVVEVANELLLRKKNLQLQVSRSASVGNYNRITKEDLINDWFTSLFDKRMAEARIGFRDQKRTGRSASGKSPGESDGLITDSKNCRIAIFEAFRLFALNTTTIDEHLNKISGYDAEALSPVFIVAYCDVADFCQLKLAYRNYISTSDYQGYKNQGNTLQTDNDADTDQLWLGKEQRLRGAREVTFYHLLLNMR